VVDARTPKAALTMTEQTITRDRFFAATGREPMQDDLDRCNCRLAGRHGHTCCGWNETLDKPQFDVGPVNRGEEADAVEQKEP
jgi:hypothetical protein